MEMTYSLIIPAYNESERITATLDKVLAYISQQHWQCEVIVVNDGSSDSTADIVRGYAKSHPIVRLVENPGNRGKGYSVRNGVMNSHGDVLLFSDADLSSPIYEAPKLFREIAAGADIAIGSRWLKKETQTVRQPFYRQVAGRVGNILLRILLGLRYKDTQCGFKAFTRAAAMQLFPRQTIERWGFDFELLYLAKRLRLKVVEIPVEWADDRRTKINPLKDAVKTFGELLKVRWNALSGRYSDAVPAAIPQAGTK
jgi:dolichyl-phosphate beta-glucosyltransferase